MKILIGSFLILGSAAFPGDSRAADIVNNATTTLTSDLTYSLNVIVRGVRNNSGVIVVSLCSEGQKFPSGCTVRESGKAIKGSTKVTFNKLYKGKYAAALFHDENNDGKLTFIKEGIAFSNDSNLSFGAPQFSPASFDLDGEKKIKINMRYFN